MRLIRLTLAAAVLSGAGVVASCNSVDREFAGTPPEDWPSTRYIRALRTSGGDA